MRAFQAFYLAVYNRSSEAASLVDSASRVGQESGHSFINLICSITRGVICLNESESNAAIPLLRKAVSAADEHSHDSSCVYALEALAQAYRVAGDPLPADALLRRGKKLRESMSMSYTPFDQAFHALGGRRKAASPSPYLSRIK
jgi:ATP/maltotriose-dependent transcriptional regulator MalT